MDDYTKQKLDELTYTLFKSGREIGDENLNILFEHLNIKPFDENFEYVSEKFDSLKPGKHSKYKKLTLRLDPENQELLTKMEKRFPSLSQNQVLNHIIKYGSEKILEVMGDQVELKNYTGLVLSEIGKDNLSKTEPVPFQCAVAEKSVFIVQKDRLIFITSKGEEFEVALKKI